MLTPLTAVLADYRTTIKRWYKRRKSATQSGRNNGIESCVIKGVIIAFSDRFGRGIYSIPMSNEENSL